MKMTSDVRKFFLMAHVTFSVGWLGAVIAYLVLAITGMLHQEVLIVRSAYLMMELLGWYVIVPFSLSTLVTGLIQSFGTSWGLFRHYWVTTKFLLNIVGTIILLVHMRTVSHAAHLAREATFSITELGHEKFQLIVHPAGGVVILIAAILLAVYKPWGTIQGKRT